MAGNHRLDTQAALAAGQAPPGDAARSAIGGRARVSESLGLSRTTNSLVRDQGVPTAPPARLAYRWPPLSPPDERELVGAYEGLTGRKVWRSVLRLLALAYRRHGPDTITCLRQLYLEDGVQDLLARLIAGLPRLEPHPDYADQGDSSSSPSTPVVTASPTASASWSHEEIAEVLAEAAPCEPVPPLHPDDRRLDQVKPAEPSQALRLFDMAAVRPSRASPTSRALSR